MNKAFVLLSLAALLFTGAAAFASRRDRGARKRPLEEAPPEARLRLNPFAGKREAVRAGGKLFRRHCAPCHGDDAHGRGKAPSLRDPAVEYATPGQLEWFLKNGNLRAGMPSWSRLPAQQRWQIVSFLKTIQ